MIWYLMKPGSRLTSLGFSSTKGIRKSIHTRKTEFPGSECFFLSFSSCKIQKISTGTLIIADQLIHHLPIVI